MENTEYLIVGGGLAGGHAASAIRERDKSGRVVLITDESHIPYDRVPLSKAYLAGKARLENLFFLRKEFYDQNKVEVVTSCKADTLDRGERTVHLEDGQVFHFNKLLLATGGRARRINLPGSNLARIYYLRTIEDCESLKLEMARSRKVVVVGGGFIGCELAAAFASRGLETTIIEVGPTLLNMALDGETASWISDYFRNKGITLKTNSAALRFVERDGKVAAVETGDGMVPADFVAVGVGIAPNSELAEKAGLRIENGILVNEFLETEENGIFAAGDVARFYSPLFKHHIRVEHYDVSVKHGKLAGGNMTGESRAFSELPYFFSFMFDLNMNVYGDMSAREQSVRRGSLNSEKGFFQFYLAGGRVVAFLSMNRSREEIKLAKSLVLNAKPIESPSSLADETRSLEQFV